MVAQQRYTCRVRSAFAPIRPWLINAGLLILTIVIVLLLGEFFLRVTGIQKVVPLNPPIYRADPDPEISYSLIPSHAASAYGSWVVTNSLGFRSPELPKGASPLVLLGDSLVFGFGVAQDQMIGSDLQRMLPGVPVLSAGASGYNVSQERALFERSIAPLHPRGLFLFFVGNDFDPTLTLDPQGYLRSSGSALTYSQELDQSIHQAGTLPIPFKTFLQRHSALFTFLERATKSLPLRKHGTPPNVFVDSVTDAQLQAYGAQLHRLSQAAGPIPKLFVIWPEENLHLHAREVLRQMAAREGFAVLDLYDIYGNTYASLGWDGHPNAATNRRTASLLFDAIKAFPSLRGLAP